MRSDSLLGSVAGTSSLANMDGSVHKIVLNNSKLKMEEILLKNQSIFCKKLTSMPT